MVLLKPLIVLMPIAVLVGGCMESKSASFNACHEEYVGYFLKPRPQGRPPDDYLIGSLASCMRRKSYTAVNKPEANCASPRTVTADCFQFEWMLAVMRAIFR